MTISTQTNGLRFLLIAAATLTILAIVRPAAAQWSHSQGIDPAVHGWRGHSWITPASVPRSDQLPFHSDGYLPADLRATGWPDIPAFHSPSLPRPVQPPAAPLYQLPNYEWHDYAPFNSVSLFQPPAAPDAAEQPDDEATPAADSSSNGASSRRSRTRVRDASGNKQQTDSFTSNTFTFENSDLLIDGVVDFPVPGRVKIAENNSAMPEDRVYFVFKHFHNTLNTTIGDGVATTLAARDFSINRYVAGFEKTFQDGLWSWEIRVPLTSDLAQVFNQGLAADVGGIGNLSLTLKRLLYVSDRTALAAGFAVSLPTGQDSRFTLGNEVFTLHNQSAHLLPYALFVAAPNDLVFYRGSLQVDVPATGNHFDVRDVRFGAAVTDLGSFRDQTLLYAGLSAGVWLYQNPDSYRLTGLASAVDLQYTGTLDGANRFSGNTSDTLFSLGRAANEISLLNMSFGLFARFGDRTTTYAGAVFPLDGGIDRFFDAEVQFSANYAF